MLPSSWSFMLDYYNLWMRKLSICNLLALSNWELIQIWPNYIDKPSIEINAQFIYCVWNLNPQNDFWYFIFSSMHIFLWSKKWLPKWKLNNAPNWNNSIPCNKNKSKNLSGIKNIPASLKYNVITPLLYCTRTWHIQRCYCYWQKPNYLYCGVLKSFWFDSLSKNLTKWSNLF